MDHNTPYTPGPWYAVDYGGFWSMQADPHYAENADLFDEDKFDEAPQNAQLASCSTLLLEALQEAITSALEDRKWDRENARLHPEEVHYIRPLPAWFNKAKEAIDKALNK